MKLLPLIVASAFVIATSSSYAQDKKTFLNDLEACAAKVFELQKDVARADESKALQDGIGAGVTMLAKQMKDENERLAEQNKKLLDALLKLQSATK